MSGYRPARDVCQAVPSSGARELCDRNGAMRLAAEIGEWWHSRGFPEVHAWAEKARWVRADGRVQGGGAEGLWVVRTDLVNGLPPRG